MSTAAAPASGSLFIAWSALVWLSFRRLWWSLHSLVAVLLLLLVAALVLVQSAQNLYPQEGSGTGYWGWRTIPFTKAVILNLYLSFILPILCLCFSTQSIGGEWEDRSLVWLLTRPLPRPLIYLGKFVAAIPWVFALTLGGFFLLGVLGGRGGLRAVEYFWPAVALGTVAYMSLFQLLGAAFRRSTIIGVVYAFVLETLVGNMPGLVKRASIAFYARCVVFEIAAENGLNQAGAGSSTGIVPDKTAFFLPVEGSTAVTLLVAITLVFLVLGTIVFSRREYHELP